MMVSFLSASADSKSAGPSEKATGSGPSAWSSEPFAIVLQRGGKLPSDSFGPGPTSEGRSETAIDNSEVDADDVLGMAVAAFEPVATENPPISLGDLEPGGKDHDFRSDEFLLAAPERMEVRSKASSTQMAEWTGAFSTVPTQAAPEFSPVQIVGPLELAASRPQSSAQSPSASAVLETLAGEGIDTTVAPQAITPGPELQTILLPEALQTESVADLPQLSPETSEEAGPAAALAAPPQTTPSPPASAPASSSHQSLVLVASMDQLPEVLTELPMRVRESEDRIHIQLDPPELGRIALDFKFSPNGLQHVSVIAETPEALNALRNMHQQLILALESQGFARETISFSHSSGSFGDPNSGHEQTYVQTGRAGAHETEAAMAGVDDDALVASSKSAIRLLSERLDIRL